MAESIKSDSENYRKGFVGRHPVAVFFALACFLSLFVVLFQPFSAVAVETVEKMGVPFRTSIIFGLQVFLTNPETFMGIIGSLYHPFTPTFAALIVVGYLGGWKAIRELLSRLRPWQANVSTQDGIKIWLIAIATYMAMNGASAFISYSLAGPGEFTWTPGQFGWLPVWAWLLAGLITDGGGVGEELGWRGFGSSFLQSKYGPLKAAIILGLLWAAWHFPLGLPGLFEDPLEWMSTNIPFTLGCTAGTIVMVYFSNRLGGSALIGVMIHSQMNDSFNMRGVLADNGQNGTFEFDAFVVCELIAAAIVIYISKGQLAFNRDNPGRQVWTWPKQDGQKPIMQSVGS